MDYYVVLKDMIDMKKMNKCNYTGDETSYPQTVYCPVIDKTIDGGRCLAICDVADNFISEVFLKETLKRNGMKN